MDVLLGLIGAVAEGSDFVEALQDDDAVAVFQEGIEAADAVIQLRESYKKFESSLSSSLSSSSRTASTSSSSSIQSDNSVEVKWSDKSLEAKIGLSNVPEKYLIKCQASELFLIEDVVQATCDLTYGSGEKISSNSYGILKGYDKKGYMIIHWLVDGMGELPGTPSIYLKKCDQRKFFKVGDIVQALYDLSFGTEASTVLKGSKGTLKELDDGGSWTVDWWNGITDVSTKQEYLLKCDQSKFFKVGEVVKAKFNLTWPSGEAVSAGTFGTLTLWDMKSNHWDVNWWDDIGELGVSHEHLQKCHHTEYCLPDDVFKTSHDLTFGELGTVPKGSLCKRVYCSQRLDL